MYRRTEKPNLNSGTHRFLDSLDPARRTDPRSSAHKEREKGNQSPARRLLTLGLTEGGGNAAAPAKLSVRPIRRMISVADVSVPLAWTDWWRVVLQ